MPIENGLPTQPRRGRAITVRTPGRTSGFMDPNVSALEDPAAIEAEDLLDADATDEELEELEGLEGLEGLEPYLYAVHYIVIYCVSIF